MTKIKRIVLAQHGENSFRVVRMVNTLRHQIGEIISRRDVDSLMAARGVEVVVQAEAQR